MMQDLTAYRKAHLLLPLLHHPLLQTALTVVKQSWLGLQDLTAYKKFKEKAVASAARSLITLFRDIAPYMLEKKDRGRGADLEARPKQYGAAYVAVRDAFMVLKGLGFRVSFPAMCTMCTCCGDRSALGLNHLQAVLLCPDGQVTVHVSDHEQ